MYCTVLISLYQDRDYGNHMLEESVSTTYYSSSLSSYGNPKRLTGSSFEGSSDSAARLPSFTKCPSRELLSLFTFPVALEVCVSSAD